MALLMFAQPCRVEARGDWLASAALCAFVFDVDRSSTGQWSTGHPPRAVVPGHPAGLYRRPTVAHQGKHRGGDEV